MKDVVQGISSVTANTEGQLVVRFNPQIVTNLAERTQPYKNFPNTMRPALEKVADYVRIEMIPRTFQQEGPGWRQLSRRTQRERTEQGYGAKHPILIRSKDLYKELTEKSHPKHIEVIKTGKYARLVLGGSSEKFTRNQKGDKSLHIPPRPMIPGTGGMSLPEQDRARIQDILTTSIQTELTKRGQ